MELARYDTALACEVAATRWYLGTGVAVGRAAVTNMVVPANNATLLAELRADARRKGKAPKRPPKAPYPFALEGRYRAQLRRRTRQTHKLLLQAMKAALAPLAEGINERAKQRDRADAQELAAAAGYEVGDLALAELLVSCRLDSPATDRRALLRVIDKVQAAVAAGSPVTPATMGPLAELVGKFVTRSVTNQVQTVVAVDLLATLGEASQLLDEWAEAQVDLITSLDRRYFDEIREAVKHTITEGHSTRSLSKAIQERYRVSRSRADLIAVDQVGTLNGKVTQQRQTSLGIDEYIWSDSGDGRVRPMHRPPGASGAVAGSLGGTRRKWSEPHPTEGHPGFAIRCRCSALPAF